MEWNRTVIPGPDVSCLDAAEILVDEFIQDKGLWPHPSDRNELVRRIGGLLSLQREALREEVSKVLEALRKAHFALQMGHNDYTDYGLASAIALLHSLDSAPARPPDDENPNEIKGGM